MAFTATITDAQRVDQTLNVEVSYDNGTGWTERRVFNFNDPAIKLVDVQAEIVRVGTALKAAQAGETTFKSRIGTVFTI